MSHTAFADFDFMGAPVANRPWQSIGIFKAIEGGKLFQVYLPPQVRVHHLNKIAGRCGAPRAYGLAGQLIPFLLSVLFGKGAC